MKEITSAVAALQKRADVLLKLAKALTHLDNFASGSGVRRRRQQGKKHISNAGRQRIRIAQRKRWAAFRKAKKTA